jgi:hypothetical protein
VDRDDAISNLKDLSHLKRESAKNIFNFYKLATKSENPMEWRSFQVQQLYGWCLRPFITHQITLKSRTNFQNKLHMFNQSFFFLFWDVSQELYYIERMLSAEAMDYLETVFSTPNYRAFTIRQFRSLHAFKSDWLGLEKLNENPEFQASIECIVSYLVCSVEDMI